MSEFYAVIADIHGQSSLLTATLSEIYSHGIKKVIFLGDYIDRGPDSLGVLDIVMQPPENVTFICLKGNHEDMQSESPNIFYCGKMKMQCEGYLEDKYMDFIKSLDLFHIEGHNIFAHAYFEENYLYEDPRFIASNVLWKRYLTGQGFYSDNYHLTHGHTPFRDKIEMEENRTNLDVGAMYGKTMCFAIFKKNVKGPMYSCFVTKEVKKVYFKMDVQNITGVEISVDKVTQD